MDRMDEFESLQQDLDRFRGCFRVLSRFHDAANKILARGKQLNDDEIVANIIVGGSDGMTGTIMESLTWSELRSLAHLYKHCLNEERKFRETIRDVDGDARESLGGTVRNLDKYPKPLL